MGKKFTAQALRQIQYLSCPTAHPEGKDAVCVYSRHRGSDGCYETWLVRTEAESGCQERLTDPAEGNASLPVYSPDGRYLAYLWNEAGEDQIWVMEMESRERRQITALRRGVNWYCWHPSGEELLLEAGCYEEEIQDGSWQKEMSAGERRDWQRQKERKPVIIEKPVNKDNSVYGLLDGRVEKAVRVNLDGRMEILSQIDFKVKYPVYAPDGTKIAFYGYPYKGVWEPDGEIFVCSPDGSELVQLTEKGRPNAEVPPVFTADGNAVIYSSYYEGKEGGCEERLFRVDPGKTVTPLFGEREETESHGVNGQPCSRTVYGRETSYFQLEGNQLEGEDLLWIRSSCEGYERVFQMKADGSGEIRKPFEIPMSIHSFCIPRGGRMFFTAGDYTTITELYEMDMASGSYRKLTDANPWLREYDISVPREMWVETEDKKAKIQVWIIPPTDCEPGKRCPAVLDVHGGPECSYTVDFWHEFQAAAAEGMAVIYCNPRGSFGYGVEFSRDAYSWGEEACQDLLTAVKAAVDMGIADPDRVGITGGSYGGFMTNKMIEKTDRFAAAVTQRCLINTATSYGCGDMGFESRRLKEGEKLHMSKVLERRARGCLMKDIDSIHTPLLILHGYKDYRCTFEQAEQIFIGMKERHPEVPVRMVMFPEENHDITREGNLYDQICHLQELINWFIRYLKEEGKGGEKDE